MEQTTITTADEVTSEVLQAAEEASEWFEGRIDWEDYWDRLDEYGFFIADMTSPAARKIERHIREFRRDT